MSADTAIPKSRELKFRIWRGNKETPDFSYCNLYDAELIVNPFWDTHVSQFTGLHDSNGKEIYEGDIVMVNGETFKVIYNRKGCWAMRYSDSDPNDYLFDQMVEGKTVVTVIGNVWENPDLLKGVT